MRICLLYLFIGLFLFVTADGQYYYFRHYQEENGLSHNTCISIIQDKKGFLWFGTRDGLNRFDGYHFKTFTIETINKTIFSGDRINSLAMNDKGVLWVGTSKGLCYFNAATERLLPFIDTIGNVDNLLFDRSGQLWFISRRITYCYNFQLKKLKSFNPNTFFRASAICQTNDGAIWIAAARGALMKYDSIHNTFQEFNVFSKSPAPISHWIHKIISGNDCTILVGTESQGMKEFNTQTGQYRDLLIANADNTPIFVRDIIRINLNEFWIATESGIFIYHIEEGKFINIQKKYLDPYNLSDNAIYCLFKDVEGGIWAGTLYGGVDYYTKQYVVFQKYYPDYTDRSISGNVIREIQKDQYGNLWIGTEDAGLCKLDHTTGKFTYFMPDGTAQGISYSNIHGLLAIGKELWIGTYEHGLDIMDIRTGKVIRRYIHGPGPRQLKSNLIQSIVQAKDGTIYLGSSHFLYSYNRKEDNFHVVDFVPETAFITCMIEDHEGTIWIGTIDDGIYYFNKNKNKKGHLHRVNNLNTNGINSLYEDHLHQIWIATDGGGLCLYNPATNYFKRYTTKNGFPSNLVFKILEDNFKTLWATTSKGLIHLEDNKITVYTKANGLLNDQFNYNSGFKNNDGSLFFGSIKGMIRFNPADFIKNTFIPPVYFTGFQINNNEVQAGDSSFLKKSIILTTSIELPYNKSTFSIDFSALSFTAPEMTRFTYIMEGLDKEWTNLNSNRRIYFTNLAPGQYSLKIKALINDRWTRVRKLDIQILPPFWATKGAYFTYIIVLILITLFLIQFYHEKLRIKKEKELYEAKMDFFTKVAHEIKTPLTLITGPLSNLSDEIQHFPEIKEDVYMMEKNTNRLLNLVTQVLDFRKVETQGFSLDFTEVNTTVLLRDTFLNFKTMAKKKNLSYTLTLPPRDIFIDADPDALQKILTNLISNAVKYATKTVIISIHIPETTATHINIQIQNDGFIIPAQASEQIFEPFYRLRETSRQKGTGIGLALARSLTELHNGKLYLSFHDKTLNTFILSLPVQRSLRKKNKN